MNTDSFIIHIHTKYIQKDIADDLGKRFVTSKGLVAHNFNQLSLNSSTKPELRFCASSNPARGVSEIRDGEDL